jgi:16S rRNA processing protein RimM
MENKPLIVGRINGVFGVKGWVKVFSFTDPIGNIVNYQPWQVKTAQGWQLMKVCESQAPQGGKAITVHLEGINTREQARDLMGADIAIFRDQLPDDQAGFYWHDLVGMTVENRDGHCLGQITEFVETGAHDVMRVSGEQSYLIPFVMDVYVVSVDFEQKTILVDWPLEQD